MEASFLEICLHWILLYDNWNDGSSPMPFFVWSTKVRVLSQLDLSTTLISHLSVMFSIAVSDPTPDFILTILRFPKPTRLLMVFSTSYSQIFHPGILSILSCKSLNGINRKFSHWPSSVLLPWSISWNLYARVTLSIPKEIIILNFKIAEHWGTALAKFSSV